MSATSDTRAVRASRVVILTALVVFTVMPLVSMVTTALQPQGSSPAGLAVPEHPQWHNFIDAWNAANFLELLKSSSIIALAVVPVSVLFATFAGYGLAQVRVPAGRLLLVVFIIGLTLPAEALISPLYYQMQGLGLLGTRWALILPIIGLLMPFGVYWMRANFVGIPGELREAAEVDGANSWQQFWRVQLPLVLPAWSTLAILFFIWTWNQFLLAIVLVNDPNQRTMAGGLGAFQGAHNTNIVLLTAGSLIIMAPALLLFVIFQRRFVSALLEGATK